MQSSNISLCSKCLLWTIYEEGHQCLLKDINFVSHVEINCSRYIHQISKDGSNWTDIPPIPSFMMKEVRELFGSD